MWSHGPVASFERAGETIAYDDAGGAGPVVVCAHNLLLDRTSFAEVARQLAGQARVVTVDLRGHGESSARGAFGVADLSGDLLALLDHLGAAKAVLVGVSLGAAAAAEVALSSPGRVAGLVLAAANVDAAANKDARELTSLALAVRLLGWRAWLRRRVLAILFGPAFRAASPARVSELEGRIAALRGGHVWRAVRAWVRRPSLRERLASLVVPTVAAIGAEDAAAPRAHAEAIAAATKGGLMVVDGAGHSVQVERPEALVGAVLGLVTS